MYPRTTTINNLRLRDLLQQKTDLVLKGRRITEDIEEIDQGNQIIDKQIQELESKVDISEFEKEAEQCTKEMEAIMNRANEIQKKIYDKVKANISPELGEKYDRNLKVKEKLENERNKIGLKIQKIKDIIVPMTQKIAKPLLRDEFEDFGDVRLENGEVVIDIFSHLEDWKKQRAKKLAIKE